MIHFQLDGKINVMFQSPPTSLHMVRAGALRPIKSPKGTSTACPQSFQERHIKVRKGTSTQRNPQVHGPIWRYQVDAYFALKCIHSYGRYYSKMKFNRKCGNLIRKSTARYGNTRLMHILHSNASTPMGDTIASRVEFQ